MTDIQMQGSLYIGIMILLGGINLFQIGKYKKGEKFPFLSVISAIVYVVALVWFFYCVTAGTFGYFYFLTTISFVIASIAEFSEFLISKRTFFGLSTAMLSCIPWLLAIWILAKTV